MTNEPPKPPNKNDSPYRALGVVSAIGTDLAMCVLGGVYLGKWIDAAAGTSPAFLIVGLFVGLGVGIYSIMLLIKKFM